jgi:hypothetical protein
MTLAPGYQVDLAARVRAWIDHPSWGWHAADARGEPGGHLPPQYLRGRDPGLFELEGGHSRTRSARAAFSVERGGAFRGPASGHAWTGHL